MQADKLTSILKIAAALCLAALGVLAGVVAFIAFVDVRPAVQAWGAAPGEIGGLRAAVERVPGEIAREVLPVVDKHAGLIRRDFFGAVRRLEVKILDPETGQFSALRADVLRRADEGLEIIRDLRAKDVAPVLAAASGSITEIREGLRPTLANIASITNHGDAAAAILFRRDALPAHLLGLTAAGKVTLGEAAQTMKVFRAAAPQFVSQTSAIQMEFHQITQNVNRLTRPRWYDRLIGYGMTGVIGYRALNPASVTLRAADIVAGRQ